MCICVCAFKPLIQQKQKKPAYIWQENNYAENSITLPCKKFLPSKNYCTTRGFGLIMCLCLT